MAENSGITWTDHTFNPWMGCAKVSSGCHNCYAEALMDTRWGKVKWGKIGTRVRTGEKNWNEPRKWNRRAEKSGVRARVFCASLADVFEDRAELVNWRADLFELIAETDNLDWLLLTKRPENVMQMIADVVGENPNAWLRRHPNVWVGTSVENQAAADHRIPILLSIPCRLRWLSAEPLLGSIEMSQHLGTVHTDSAGIDARYAEDGYGPWVDGIGWVIAGGESGEVPRPTHPEWVRSIRDQCIAASIPFHFKQWGEWMPFDTFELAAEHEGWGERHDLCVLWPNGIGSTALMCAGDEAWENGCRGFRNVGKKTAGRLLDGRVWHEFPDNGVSV